MVDHNSDGFQSEEDLEQTEDPPQREISVGSLGRRLQTAHITSPSRPSVEASSMDEVPPIPEHPQDVATLQTVPEAKAGSDGEPVVEETGITDPYEDRPQRRRKSKPKRQRPKSKKPRPDRHAMPPPVISHKTIPKDALPSQIETAAPKPNLLNSKRRHGQRLFHPNLKPKLPKWAFVNQYPNETCNGLAFSGPLAPHEYKITESGKSAVFAFLYADDGVPQTSTPMTPQATSFLKCLHGPLTFKNTALDAGAASPLQTHPAFDGKNWYSTQQRQRILLSKTTADVSKFGWNKRPNEFTRAEKRLTTEASSLTHCPYNVIDVRTIHLGDLMNGGMVLASRQPFQLDHFSGDGAVPLSVFHDGFYRAGIREGSDGPYTSIDLPKSAQLFFFSVDPTAQIGILLEPHRKRPRGHVCHSHLVFLGNAPTKKKQRRQADYYGTKKDGIHAISAADASQFLS